MTNSDAVVGEPVQGPGGALFARAERWGAFFLYVGLVVVHLFLDLTMSGPVVYSDEGAYMGTAHLLVSGTGLLYNHSPYHPGYSLLLVPLVRFFPDPLRSYHATLILNAALLAGVGVAVFILTRYVVPRRSIALRLVIAAVVASYPSFLDYSNLIMSMNLFIPGFIVLCIVLAVAFERDRLVAWFACGVLAGALYIVHPVGLIAAGALIFVAVAIRRRRWLPTTIALLFGLQVALVPGLVLMNHVLHDNAALTKAGPLSPTAHLAIPATAPAPSSASATPTTTSTTAPVRPPSAPQSRTLDVTQRFRQNLAISRLVNDLYELGGQIFYLTVATYGLWVLGIGLALAAGWRVFARRRTDTLDQLAVFIGVVMLLTLVASTLRFNTGRQGTGEADELIYGRYNELVLAPVLVLGLVSLNRLRSRELWRMIAWPLAVAVVLAVTGASLYFGRSAAALHAVFVDVNVFALHPLLTWLGGIQVLPIALIGFGAVVVVTVLARRLGLLAVAVPVVALCVLSASFSANRLSRDSDGRTAQRVVLSAIHTIATRFGPLPSCIGYDLPVEHLWHLSNDQFFLPTTKFHRFNAFGEQPCSDLVISARTDLELTYPGAGLVTLENFSETKLWVLPGPRLDRLRAAGMVLPSPFPSVLPDSAFRSSIKVVGLGPGTDTLASGGARNLVLAVTHAGAGAPWPTRYGFDSGDGWVRLAVLWVTQSNPLVPVGSSSADLPRTVFPGDTVNVRLRLTARDVNGAPLPPGSYFVRIGLVQEGFVFFVDKGDHTLDLSVQVGPRPGSGRA